MNKPKGTDAFLATMDPSLPISHQILNAINDARSYKWDDDALRELIENIKNVYRLRGHYVGR